MVKTIHLLFPCCDTQTQVEKVDEQVCRSSAICHALTSLVLAVILGAGATLAAYFLSQGVVLWTALAGTSIATATGLITYVTLRCKYGTQEQQIESSKSQPKPKAPKPPTEKLKKPEPTAPKKDWTGRLIQVVHNYPGDLPKEQKSKLKQEETDPIFRIDFVETPSFNVTIRRENMFTSKADVLVNAANKHLGGGSGIDGAIHKYAGEKYSKEHKIELRSLYPDGYVNGHAALLGSGALNEEPFFIENIIVVAGPAQETTPQKEKELYSCYFNSLLLAHNHKKTSIAFPAISTGIFGFPKERAAEISLRAIYDFMAQHPDSPLKTISIHYLEKSEKILESYQQAIATT